MKLARLVLMMFVVAGWAGAQCGGQATAAGDKGKDSSAAAEKKEMSCGCCKDMGKKDADSKEAAKSGNKDASLAGDKDAAKSEAKAEGGIMASGMACCAKMGKDKDKDASGGGMSCGKKDDAKAGTPEQKMK